MMNTAAQVNAELRAALRSPEPSKEAIFAILERLEALGAQINPTTSPDLPEGNRVFLWAITGLCEQKSERAASMLEHAGHGWVIRSAADLLRAYHWDGEIRPVDIDEGEAEEDEEDEDEEPTPEAITSLNVIDLVDLVNAESDMDVLEDILAEEQTGRNRSTAVSAIRERLKALGGDDGDGA